MPHLSLNTETGEIEVRDAEGKPQRIKLELPEGGDYALTFPILITDRDGNSYQMSAPTPSEMRDVAGVGWGVSVGSQNNAHVLSFFAKELILESENEEYGRPLSQQEVDHGRSFLRSLCEKLQLVDFRAQTLSPRERMYLDHVDKHLNFLRDSNNVVFESYRESNVASGWYKEGKIHIYLPVIRSDDDVLSTIFHEYLHHINRLEKILQYRYADSIALKIYREQVDEYDFRAMSEEEMYDQFIMKYISMPSYKDYPLNYSETTIEQKEAFSQLIKQNPQWQEIRPVFGIYKPSNYFLEEQIIHTIIHKMDGILYRMTPNKRKINSKVIDDYKVLHSRAQAYEYRNKIDSTGYKLIN